MNKYNYITYWCQHCGLTIRHVDCDMQPIYYYCPHCLSDTPTLFYKDKEAVIKKLDEKRRQLNNVLCHLLGIQYEEVIKQGGMHVVMKKYFEDI